MKIKHILTGEIFDSDTCPLGYELVDKEIDDGIEVEEITTGQYLIGLIAEIVDRLEIMAHVIAEGEKGYDDKETEEN